MNGLDSPLLSLHSCMMAFKQSFLFHLCFKILISNPAFFFNIRTIALFHARKAKKKHTKVKNESKTTSKQTLVDNISSWLHPLWLNESRYCAIKLADELLNSFQNLLYSRSLFSYILEE